MSDRRVLLLARHGETEWNRIGRWQGATDVPLNEDGRAQAAALAEALRSHGVGAIVSSDLSRAQETATIVATHLGVAYRGAHRELRERSYGVFEGLTREECRAKYPQIWLRHFPGALIEPPEAESRADVALRMRAKLEQLATLHEDERPLLVVSHGGALRTFLDEVWDLVPPMNNGTTYRAVFREGRFSGFELLIDRLTGDVG